MPDDLSQVECARAAQWDPQEVGIRLAGERLKFMRSHDLVAARTFLGSEARSDLRASDRILAAVRARVFA